MAYDFPSDLIEASRTCESLRAQIEALPVDELTLDNGTPVVRKRPVKAYTDEERAQVDALRTRRLEAATAVVCHTFWSSVEAGKVAKARSALKHYTEAA